MKKLGLAVALSAAFGLTSTATLANNAPSFDYVSGAYVNLDADGTHIGGGQLEYSQSFSDIWFGYSFARHFTKGELDNTSLGLGIGYKYGISDATALYGIAGLVYDEVTWGSLSESETGYAINAGVRHALTDLFEIDAHIQHVDIWEDTEQNYTLSGKYFFNPAWAIQAGYTHVDSDDSVTFIGLSYEF